MSHPPVVSLRAVDKTYPSGTRALAAVDLEVRRGEFLALLGPSGCGKSTVMRLVAGLAAPSGGDIAWHTGGTSGRPPPGDLAVVFQEPTLMPWASVAANARLPLVLTGRLADADARVAAALARVGLAEFAGAYPRELSGGMKMRAAIARALVTEPSVLLMDEPFAALDEITRFRLDNELSALWRTLRPTVLFVTHSVFEAVYLATRIVVMTPRPGRVFADIANDVTVARDEAFRTSADYVARCRAVAAALAAAMGEVAA